MQSRPDPILPRGLIAGVADRTRREDAEKLLVWFEEVTGLEPKMWGTGIIGFGRYRYKYESGREGEYFLTGFSPRKATTTVYILPGYRFGEMQGKLDRLGPHKLGKSCLYIKKLADIDLAVLREIVEDGLAHMRANYETWDA